MELVKTLSSSLSKSIRESILTMLANGSLRPGAPLDERKLAQEFGVSRTPVREAVVYLVARGFLTMDARAGIAAPKLSLRTLRELLELLGELEAVAARLAAKRANSEERALLQQTLAACEAAEATVDIEGYEAANTAFHGVIYTACRNDSLVDQVKSIRFRCLGYTRGRFESPGRMLRSLSEHKAIGNAICNSDEFAAHLAMMEHISIGGREFSEFVSGLSPDLIAV